MPLLMASAAAVAEPAAAIQYGPPPAWILPPPKAAAAIGASDAALRIVYQDTEQRVNGATTETYSAFRIKILKPEALAIGNLSVSWSPSDGPATVNFVRILRDGQLIDVLDETKFKVIERETGLEKSMLDGNLTATLQVPGLQVGDELEFGVTVDRHQPAFGNHAAGIAILSLAGLPGDFRYRTLWSADKKLNWRLTKDLPPATNSTVAGFKVLQVELHDPHIVPDPDGAPPRYKLHRAVEFSDYAGWPDLSKQMWALFDTASRLQPGSPIESEASKIAAAFPGAAERAQAALRLVQEQIRYVYVGLNGGNYVPAAADVTWQRRFGDCKGKTALLLALLHRLGIKAEAVMVNSKGGDGTNEWLPDPELFDHVLVRATIAGKDYWLDGTRTGDRYLDMLPQPSFEWGLPLTQAGADLLAVPPTTSRYPQLIQVVDIDASAGFDKDGMWSVKHVLRGDDAYQIETALSTVSPADAERAVREYFHGQLSDVEPNEVSWHYDDRHAALVLTMKGKGPVDWDGDDKQGHSYKLPGGGFYAPDKLQRPKDEDQTAAWAVDYPVFKCFATTIHLPPATNGFHWTLSSDPINRRFGGHIYWRASGLKGNVARLVMSRQNYLREVPAVEAAKVNAEIATFDNYMSSVDESSSGSAKSSPLPFDTEPDWAADPEVCSPPAPVAGKAD